jgi:hypothetical protein
MLLLQQPVKRPDVGCCPVGCIEPAALHQQIACTRLSKPNSGQSISEQLHAQSLPAAAGSRRSMKFGSNLQLCPMARDAPASIASACRSSILYRATSASVIPVIAVMRGSSRTPGSSNQLRGGMTPTIFPSASAC